MLIRVGKAQRHPRFAAAAQEDDGSTLQSWQALGPGSTRERRRAQQRTAVAVTMTLTVTARRRRRSWKWAGWDDGSGQYLGGIIGVVDQARCAALSMRVGNRAEGRGQQTAFPPKSREVWYRRTRTKKGRWSPGAPGEQEEGRAKLFDWPCLLACSTQAGRPYRDRNHRNRLPALHGTVASLNRNKWAL